MRIKLFAVTAVAAAGLSLSGCSSSSTDSSSAPASMSTSMATSMATPMATSMQTSSAAMMHSATGTFGGLNDKKVAGTATVADGKVELSGFSSDEGPDLHIYLTNGTDEQAVSAGKELGKIVFDQASQTFTIPSGVDAATYKDVVIHCDKAKAVFGAASLS